MALWLKRLEEAAMPVADLIQTVQDNPIWIVGGVVAAVLAFIWKLLADRRKAAQERERQAAEEAERAAAAARADEQDRARKRAEADNAARLRAMDARLATMAEHVAAEKGVPLPAMRAILAGFGEEAEALAPSELETRLQAKAGDYRDLAQRLTALSNADPAVTKLRADAKTHIDAGDFAAADAALARAEAIDANAVEDLETRARERRLSRAQSLAERAGLALLRDALKDAATLYAKAADAAPQDARVERLRWLQFQADVLRQQGERFVDNDALREAVAILDGPCSELAHRDDNPIGWALTRMNLGVVLLRLGERGDDAALKQGVAAFRAALEVMTRDRDPAGWAQVQGNLSGALLRLGERGDAAALAQSVVAIRAAQEVMTRERYPAGWAMAQSNLGLALMRLGEWGDDEALAQSVVVLKGALELRTRDRDPIGWAQTQSNLGFALMRLGERGDEAAFAQSIEVFSAALEVLTRERDPAGWAVTQTGLATTRMRLGERGDEAALAQGVADFRAALEVLTRDRDPAGWAATQTNLGIALARLGERGDDSVLAQSVAAFRDALTIRTRDRDPAGWALTQLNLGNALSIQANRLGSRDLLEEALAATDLALEEFTQERYPAYNEMAQGNRTVILAELEKLA